MSKLTRFAGIFFVLALETTTLFAQNQRNYCLNNGEPGNYCISQLQELNDEQKQKIEILNQKHRATMAEWREQQRSATNAIEKNEIRTTMLKNAETHRNEVRSLLTAEQLKEYNSMLSCRNGKLQGQRQGKGTCQFANNPGKRGNGNGSRQGNGTGSRQGNGNGNRRNQECFRY